MIKYHSTCKDLACNYNCELSLYYEDKESYHFNVKILEG